MLKQLEKRAYLDLVREVSNPKMVSKEIVHQGIFMKKIVTAIVMLVSLTTYGKTTEAFKSAFILKEKKEKSLQFEINR